MNQKTEPNTISVRNKLKTFFHLQHEKYIVNFISQNACIENKRNKLQHN